MTKKIFNLSAEELEIIESVREQHNYKTQVEALRYLLQSYKNGRTESEKSKEIAEAVLEIFLKNYEASWKRLYMSTRQTDKKISILMDAVNTVLVENAYEHNISVDVAESPVFSEAKESLKVKIQKRKQYRDRQRRLKKSREE